MDIDIYFRYQNNIKLIYNINNYVKRDKYNKLLSFFINENNLKI